MYTRSGAAYGLERNLMKACNQSVSKVRHFLHSNTSYTKVTLATGKFKRMKTLAGFKKELWCMDLAYFHKLAKDNNGLKYLLFRQDLFDRTVDAKEVKTKVSKETVRAFLTTITKKNRAKSVWAEKGTEFAREFKKICHAEGIQIYSTMSGIKAVLPERTTRSLKNILYRYMEDTAYKCIYKLTQFVTTLNSRRNCSIDLIPKECKEFRLFVHSVQQTTSRI